MSLNGTRGSDGDFEILTSSTAAKTNIPLHRNPSTDPECHETLRGYS
jgi:hypothetical protein